MKLLEKLTQTPGVPGREQRVRQVILDEAGHLFDDTVVDNLGTLICHRKPRPAKDAKGKDGKTKAQKPGADKSKPDKPKGK